MTSLPHTDHLQALADALWSERQVVEFLLYKLTSAKLLLEADQRRFVPHALEEVEHVVVALRRHEMERQTAIVLVAHAWQITADDLTLRLLAAAAGEPWREIFTDHERSFTQLAAEIKEAVTADRILAAEPLAEILRALGPLTGDSTSHV